MATKFDYSVSPWMFNDSAVESVPEKATGFVYIITVKHTEMKYIGKKSFYAHRRLKPTDKRRTTVESDWKKYISSSDKIKEIVKEHGFDSIRREILVICENDKTMNYMEVKYQFVFGVLENPAEWLNDNINALWYSKNYKGIRSESLLSNTLI